jgi:ankyrin repeat protein
LLKTYKLLIDSGADVNAKRNIGRTALHDVASGGHRDMVELLIAKGSDLNVIDNAGRTPLDMAEKRGNNEIVELLKKHGAAIFRKLI